jgi:hypothetical protein
MKNINDKTKKRLIITGCLALCVVLVALIGQQFQSPKPVDDPLPPQSSGVSDVTINPNASGNAENEKEVIVTPPDTTQPENTDNGAVSSGTEQTIQSDVTKPEYTEEQLKDPTQKPDGEKVTEPPKPTDHDKVEKPKEPLKPQNSPKPGGGNSIPGFDNVPDGGANKVINADDMYENGNKIGNMD